jgi:hypothetical protein
MDSKFKFGKNCLIVCSKKKNQKKIKKFAQKNDNWEKTKKTLWQFEWCYLVPMLSLL